MLTTKYVQNVDSGFVSVMLFVN